MNSLEIDFLYVNSGKKSGDAITFRYGDFSHASLQKVVVIDGGTTQSGKDLVTHINNLYNTNTVDLVICTHPDGDHASGLREVLRTCEVQQLWIHKPWAHSKEILDMFHDGRITSDSLDARIREAYNYAHELVEIAEEKGIQVVEPFQGTTFDGGIIRVMGPSLPYYLHLVPNFLKTPATSSFAGVANRTYTAIREAISWIHDAMHLELLDESGVTTAENMSSVVTLLTFNNRKFLFTGDVGIQGLKNVAAYANSIGINLTDLEAMQVPHHGSRRNISDSILNAIRGKHAYVSASRESDKHPSKKVTNAFLKKGMKVFPITGPVLCHRFNCPPRPGYGPVEALPFFNQVEE